MTQATLARWARPDQRDAIIYGLARAATGSCDPFGHPYHCRLCRALHHWYQDTPGSVARPPHPWWGPYCPICRAALRWATGASVERRASQDEE